MNKTALINYIEHLQEKASTTSYLEVNDKALVLFTPLGVSRMERLGLPYARINFTDEGEIRLDPMGYPVLLKPDFRNDQIEEIAKIYSEVLGEIHIEVTYRRDFERLTYKVIPRDTLRLFIEQQLDQAKYGVYVGWDRGSGTILTKKGANFAGFGSTKKVKVDHINGFIDGYDFVLSNISLTFLIEPEIKVKGKVMDHKGSNYKAVL